ncbi:serine hydrolase domain-containing protein [Halostreptopolyspora alba]|uniref:Class A beta-lactamase-related serine hydrolase n=1 Tax=Halostreptopolyspora alba TaxID=2487137 RepID=A0A3N0E2M6_9ACTN|nr:class A beta-lactamase-related serine hydrolase [Nocardiopsaceae bacterium YIM 96095]
MSTPTRQLVDLLEEHVGPLVGTRTPAVGAAIVRGDDAAVLAGGRPHKGQREIADAHTAFETGSLTKTCTALLLAEMVAHGDVSPTDPVETHLPRHAHPRPGKAQITLVDLATHTAGLPRLPRNLFLPAARNWLSDPYARYTREDLYHATARLRPGRFAGTPRYSTFGVGLLGQILADAAGTSYPQLLATRVLHPLGMDGSGAPPAIAPTTPHATGHHRGRPVGHWHFDALAGAGALRSTATDMLCYLRAHLHPEWLPPTLAHAVRDVALPRHRMSGPAGASGTSVALVWNHRHTHGEELLWHTGGTGGFTAFAGFSPTAVAGVAVLANTRPTHRDPVLSAARRLFRSAVFPK